MAQDKISIRVRREDIEKLNTLASSLSMTKTAIIKKVINDGFAQTVEFNNPALIASAEKIQETLKDIESQLESIGNNINQISTKLNSDEQLTEKNRQTIVAALRVIEKSTSRFDYLSDWISTRTKKTVIKKRGKK
ncbi:plasmid mobilization relaxosome protein MobC [Pseudomonas citronellolis]|uniref:plasmid mobilization relaxosome protein MobC n=1 Tax=Pseudomonas citronellolis TaxID=53408 RepID=UPI0009443B34|nr:plasmid mobilization relaxosome protein MobC [Pseudomonas citronellolis]TGC28741.1 plasmid mobilization relaxosome protein MobC [Pseudomonas citronellolis]